MKKIHFSKVEAVLPCGGRPGRGCMDQLFNLRVLVEEAVAVRRPLFAAFVDLAKAFDSLDRRLVYLMLRALGLPQLIVDLFESMYGATTRCARSVASRLRSISPASTA